MSIKSTTPYLNFGGNARQAIKLYESALGARVDGLQTFADVPGESPPPEMKDRVMHALLHVGGGQIMVSDGPPGMPIPKTSNIHVALHLDDVEETNRRFAALAAGGKVTMPLQDTFWGARFGMLTDAYDINWMFNCDLPAKG